MDTFWYDAVLKTALSVYIVISIFYFHETYGKAVDLILALVSKVSTARSFKV